MFNAHKWLRINDGCGCLFERALERGLIALGSNDDCCELAMCAEQV